MMKTHREREMCFFFFFFLPVYEERLIQAVEDINNDVVIGYRVDLRTRKLPIYQNTLKIQIHISNQNLNTLLLLLLNNAWLHSGILLSFRSTQILNLFCISTLSESSNEIKNIPRKCNQTWP